MPKIIIDGKELEAKPSETILQVAERNGIYIPRYCYHPGLSIAGNCRMCLVEIEKMPKLQIACATVAVDGMVVHTNSEKVIEARKQVLEFLLINHPVDCPICDKVGDCDLQNFYMDYSAKKSRFNLNDKVRKPKRRDLGKIILDNERCILCTRCVRFFEEITKTNELFINSRGDRSFIDIKPGLKLENNYALNVVEICPVGALTSKDFRFKKRAYQLTTTKSICTLCATGCKIKVQHNGQKIYRILSDPNPYTNTWICDNGRFGYKITEENRLVSSFINGNFKDVEDTVEEISKLFSEILKDGKKVAVLLSNYLSFEDNYSLLHLSKNILKTNQIYAFKFEEQKIEDGILINTDKTPNSNVVKKLMEKDKDIKTVDELKEYDYIIGFYEDIVKINADLNKSIVFSYKLDKKFNYLIAIKTYYETAGSFVNWQNILRETKSCVDTYPQTIEIWKFVKKVSEYFSLNSQFENFEDFKKIIANFDFSYEH